jgi:hypothetical protein
LKDLLRPNASIELTPGTGPSASMSAEMYRSEDSNHRRLRSLVRELRDLLRSDGDDEADKLSPPSAIRRAAERKLVSPETVNSMQGLAVLRNLALHGRGADVSVDRAVDYLSLADALAYTLRQGKHHS